jgi:hypothetical protein
MRRSLKKPSFVVFCLMFAVWRRSAGLTSEVALKRSPEQKEQDYDYDDEADAPTIVMVWRTKIETTPSEKEDENSQKYYQPHCIAPGIAIILLADRSKKEGPALHRAILVTSAVGSSK